MALESPKSTEVSKDLIDPVEKSYTKKLADANQVSFKPNSEEIACSEAILDSNRKTKKADKTSKAVTKSRCDKGIATSSNAKQLISDDVLLSCGRSITDLPQVLISDILNCLDPKEIGIVSCVSTNLHRIASEHHVWKEFYCERWGLPTIPLPSAGSTDQKSWRELFMEREFRSKTFMGRYSIDVLHGHTEAVRTVFLLVSAKLIFTAGYDSIVRMWDMEDGLSIASSRPLGCTIRAVAADSRLLIAGGTGGFIHCWRAEEGHSHLFELSSSHNHDSEFRLWEHEGPITSLFLDLTRIYSGSWDMTVRVWDRCSLKCIKVLRHSDWVYGLAPHDSTVVSTSGSDVYVWDSSKWNLLTVIHNAHKDNALSVARSHTGDFLFTGGGDGTIHMYEIATHCNETFALHVATWSPHTGPVYSLAFEFPWLVSASSDGKMSLIDLRRLLRTSGRALGKKVLKAKELERTTIEPPQRMLHGFGSNLYSVDIGADRIVCGGEEGVVRIWNFSQAVKAEQKARALRGIRLENRMRRRTLQAEINSKGGRSSQCSAASKKNPMNVDRSAVWHNKREMSGKLKA